MPKRGERPVHAFAPTATSTDGDILDPSVFPDEPPPPLKRPARRPLFRWLKVYAFGPSRGRAGGNVRSIPVRYEKLAPGPVGERIAVVDYDSTRDCFYDPVDLDDPLIAINGGLDPSESDPHFHQQMVYAVVSESLRRVEVALGRTIRGRSGKVAEPLRIVIYPHANQMSNAHTIDNRMMCGYFRAPPEAVGRIIPGQTVFTCLCHDVVGHQAAHVMLSAMRPDFLRGGDNMALQEALADLTPLLFHFSYREVVLDAVQRTAGVIYRSQLDVRAGDQADGPRILAELVQDNPLIALSTEFGDALGRQGGLRNALLAPDPKAFAEAKEPHDRGAIVVAAVFDALFSIYQRCTVDLFRIYRAGGGRIQGNDVPEPLAGRLYDQVERIASRFFNMCWRAVDYCPPAYCALGDFLRACITADFEYSREDPWGLRDAMMQAFRMRGISPSEVSFFSEDALKWPLVDAATLTRPGLEPSKLSQGKADAELRSFVEENGKSLGLRPSSQQWVLPLEASRLTAPDDTPHASSSTQVLDRKGGRSGLTLVFDGAGRLRYAIPASPVPADVD
jgi:hypothetical protein